MWYPKVHNDKCEYADANVEYLYADAIVDNPTGHAYEIKALYSNLCNLDVEMYVTNAQQLVNSLEHYS